MDLGRVELLADAFEMDVDNLGSDRDWVLYTAQMDPVTPCAREQRPHAYCRLMTMDLAGFDSGWPDLARISPSLSLAALLEDDLSVHDLTLLLDHATTTVGMASLKSMMPYRIMFLVPCCMGMGSGYMMKK